MNSATSENTAFQAPLCDSDAESEPEVAPSPQPDAESWRMEVAARLARYRTRRKPRSPRYPSLLLPFASPESWSKAPAPDSPPESEPAAAIEGDVPPFPALDSQGMAFPPQFVEHPRAQQLNSQPEPSAKVIEFPRSAAIPVFHASTLADPIFDRPRIVEAPEVVPPPPALGGMLIEPAEQERDDRRPAHDSHVASASIPWRALATVIDSLILAAALSAFGAIFWRFNPIREPLPLLAGMAVAVAILLWMTYQFLFIVYTGSTPGLRAARLRVVRFDGSPVTRSLRRWRVLAAFLSAFSAGLGYLWCFLDQDSLCWHDRITKTYVQSSRS